MKLSRMHFKVIAGLSIIFIVQSTAVADICPHEGYFSHGGGYITEGSAGICVPSIPGLETEAAAYAAAYDAVVARQTSYIDAYGGHYKITGQVDLINQGTTRYASGCTVEGSVYYVQFVYVLGSGVPPWMPSWILERPYYINGTFTVAKRTFAQCQQRVIRLQSAQGNLDGNNLVEVEPGKLSTKLLAMVFDQTGQVVPNMNVSLKVNAIENSGGHQHHDTGRPNGLLSDGITANVVVQGTTGNSGMNFNFLAPAPAGDHRIVATCMDQVCTQEGPDKVWVGIKDLQSLQADPSYVLITPNADQEHPSNHYVTGRTQEKIQGLATDYHELFPNDPLLYLNDSSLIRGGVFDLAANWSSQPRGHSTHQRGTDIDVMANQFYHDPAKSIPSYNYVDLMNIVAPENGCNAQIHSGATPNEHFHLYCR